MELSFCSGSPQSNLQIAQPFPCWLHCAGELRHAVRVPRVPVPYAPCVVLVSVHDVLRRQAEGRYHCRAQVRLCGCAVGCHVSRISTGVMEVCFGSGMPLASRPALEKRLPRAMFLCLARRWMGIHSLAINCRICSVCCQIWASVPSVGFAFCLMTCATRCVPRLLLSLGAVLCGTTTAAAVSSRVCHRTISSLLDTCPVSALCCGLRANPFPTFVWPNPDVPTYLHCCFGIEEHGSNGMSYLNRLAPLMHAVDAAPAVDTEAVAADLVCTGSR